MIRKEKTKQGNNNKLVRRLGEGKNSEQAAL